MDKVNPRKALAECLLLDKDEQKKIVRYVDPADVDGFIQVRILLGILGKSIAKSLLLEIDQEQDLQRKVWLISMLSMLDAENAIPTLHALIQHSDAKVRSTSIRVLGSFFNLDEGSTPGHLYILKRIEAYLESSFFRKSNLKNAVFELTRVPYAEVMSTLSSFVDFNLSDQLTLLEIAPEDITSSMNNQGVERVLHLVREKHPESILQLKNEIKSLEKYRLITRSKFLNLLRSFKSDMDQKNYELPELDDRGQLIERKKQVSFERRDLLHSLLTSLGKMKHPEDSQNIQPFVHYPSSLVRDAASIALGRIGAPSFTILNDMIQSPDTLTKLQAMIAVSHTTDPALLVILQKGLNDSDSQVQQFSLTVVEQLQSQLTTQKKQIRKKINLLKTKNPSAIQLQKDFLYGNQ